MKKNEWVMKTGAGAIRIQLLLLLFFFMSGMQEAHKSCRISSSDAGFKPLAKVFPADAKKANVFDHGLRALETCTNRYVKLKKFSIDVEYAVFYDSENFDQPDDKKTGKIVRHNDDFYQDEIGTIKIVNKDVELLVNERAEFMTIRDRVKNEIAPAPLISDSLAAYISEIEKTEHGFLYYLNKGEVEKMEMIFDREGYLETTRSWYRKKMDFGQGEVKVITQMRYLNFEKKPKISNSFFSVDPFLSISKNREVSAKGKYKKYYVLNQLARK